MSVSLFEHKRVQLAGQYNHLDFESNDLIWFTPLHLDLLLSLSWPSGKVWDCFTVYFVDMKIPNLTKPCHDTYLAVQSGISNLRSEKYKAQAQMLMFEDKKDRRGTCVGGVWKTTAEKRSMCFYVVIPENTDYQYLVCKLW